MNYKVLIPIMFVFCILFLGCAKSIDLPVQVTNISPQGDTLTTMKTMTVHPYGLFNQNEAVDGVQYQVSVGNVVFGAILFETVVAPVVIAGWYLWEPIGIKLTGVSIKAVQ